MDTSPVMKPRGIKHQIKKTGLISLPKASEFNFVQALLRKNCYCMQNSRKIELTVTFIDNFSIISFEEVYMLSGKQYFFLF
jgi:hypothetical protein